ncbi:MMPL family transporter [Actinospica robiniae]|uniref:MMPL family transporter n=1 Tax=Actinospica robiniae TaxID=304901 RepID=UPI00054E0556|nr:MMPL family transporter [Actinospica robiniae]
MLTRMGLFCFRRYRWILIVWLVVMAGGGAAIGPVFSDLSNGTTLSGTESAQASDAIQNGVDYGITYYVLVNGVDPNAPATQQALSSAESDTRAITGVKSVTGPTIAQDGKALSLTVVLDKADSQYLPYTDSRARMQQLSTALPGSTVLIGGGDLISDEANDAIQSDLTRAEELSLPVTLVVLVFIFGGVVAASLPVLAALGTVAGGFGILMCLSGLFQLDGNAVTVVSLLGLALSIDYGLLLVVRYREELTRTDDRAEAVARTWRSAGRTILFSGLTVAAALTSLLAFDIGPLRIMGVAAISTVAVAILASLTLTPAMLGLCGARVKPSQKQIARQAAAAAAAGVDDPAEHGFFAGLARITQRRPLIMTIACLALLLAIASPLLGTVIKVPQLEALPQSLESVQVANELSGEFGLTSQPGVEVVARTDTASLNAYAAQWRSDPEVLRVEPATAVNPHLSTVILAVKGDDQTAAARALVERLRADRPAGVQSWVAGDAANLIDLNDRLESGLPLAAGITVLAMVILLFLMSGSLIIPIKALLMNALSLSASFGVLVAVFQHGHLAGPLGMLVVGGLNPYMIVIVFTFGFGLSMDYEVFLLSRIREYRAEGADPDTAVRRGLQRSGRVITSAALLMLIVFAFFATAKTGQIQEIGLGLFVAVLIDATVVRCLLVPAVMTLLGSAAWWAPGPLRRFHERRGLTEEPAAPAGEPALADSSS